ncbi:monooxygenase [Bacillus mangrovi]|uniref:Monooxygenase n=1 Tax=Metabacillus mangrovi TaxID=1491830 RepID=A0A7X2V5E6_9BACI|nr:FAD-dependent monooxygenase [Metabacillus mangrovi]MTH54375.1 monooxygenase [Metabacillus mangrovi]
MSKEVLITGAGPAGLVLALRLEKHGIPFRIIEKNSGPGTSSRALVVHARTLEYYQQLGFADELINLGIVMKSVHILESGSEKAELRLADLGEGLSPYPFVLSLAQDVHEQFLVRKLEEKGIQIEWNTELVTFKEDRDGIEAVLKKGENTETSTFSYVCGCDGAHSTVRKTLGFDFPGGTYEELFYVADVKTEGQEHEEDGFYMFIDEKGFCAYIPVRTTGMRRIVGIVPPQEVPASSITFDSIRPYAEEQIGLSIKEVNWFSTYKVHHRVSEHFRKGRAFIAGDSGHIHSPAGGQGMNTGIGDAVNLSWKLAAAIKGEAHPDLLDTYESERIAFARLLVSTTDRVFKLITGGGLQGKLVRKGMFQAVLPNLLRYRAVRRKAFHLLSQTRISYRGLGLNEGRVGKLHSGDRLPWIQIGASDNYETLTSLNWQIHVYGTASDSLRTFALSHSLQLAEFQWTDKAKKAGFTKDAVYWIRPDGHIGFVFSKEQEKEIRAVLNTN